VEAGTLSPGIKTEETCGNEDMGCRVLCSAVEIVIRKGLTSRERRLSFDLFYDLLSG